ncbi:probable tRNA N6-adenosine threonylcarbamoyltransferase, mitochondrial [Anneissia japonica]|uniref:probable tRNA N6-adenosine threonylcarbamoyltransferase, mitochondrial n=1 Tax=Anneissia japonica TaxID=1529436 RepID=UPI00142591BF|nr:probable tRNA N6-adenosine threonylcarbamoyltransferase, mitochondrial [Anneissia japonica]
MICLSTILVRSRPFISYKNYVAFFSTQRKRKVVLGLETSCDETGAAVVTEDGEVLGEGLRSQKNIHVRNGGVIPPLAQALHRECIHDVVQKALDQSHLDIKDVSAIATTTMPGLALCLMVGLEYTKQLIAKTNLPFIPVHHMQAHALTVRLINRVDFPFLVLLVSGGHCLLAVARGVDDFLLLGQTLDNAPGEAFDKVARRLKLQHHPHCQGLSGGQSIEKLATEGSIRLLMGKGTSLPKSRSCDFSFSGTMSLAHWLIGVHENHQGITKDGGKHLDNLPDICASVQHKITHHLCTRVIRAINFCNQTGLIPESNQTLVASGGVASNSYIRNALETTCSALDYQLICPPPRLCTDNGIMIAWSGMERLKLGIGISNNPQDVRFEPRYPIGEDISSNVVKSNIKVKAIKFW